MKTFHPSTVLALEVALCAALLVLVLHYSFGSVYKKLTGKEQSALSYRPFSNWYTRGILLVCLTLIVSGLLIIKISHSFHGVWIGFIGALIWWAGDKNIPVKPRQAGALTLYGNFLKDSRGRPYVVGGRTILAPYWPVLLDVVMFDMTTVDWEIPMIVYAKGNDKVPRPIYGKVSVALKPDREKLIEFNQAGGMKNVKDLADDIIVREVRHLASTEEAEDIVIDPKTLSDFLHKELRKRVESVFEDKSFGVKIEKLQPHFDFSEKVRGVMEENLLEEYQRANEYLEFETDTKAAEMLLQRYRDNGDFEKTFDQCVQEIKQLRLIRDEKVLYVATSGKGNVFTELNIDMGGKGGKGKGKGKKGK